MVDKAEKVLLLKKQLENHPDDDRIILIFEKLDRIQMTIDILQSTGIGKTVNGFRKVNGFVGSEAKSLIANWKKLVSSPQGSKDQDNGEKKQHSNTHTAEIKKEKYAREIESYQTSSAAKDHQERSTQREKSTDKYKKHIKTEKADDFMKINIKQEREYSPSNSEKAKIKLEKNSESDRRSKDKHKDRNQFNERAESPKVHVKREHSNSKKHKHHKHEKAIEVSTESVYSNDYLSDEGNDRLHQGEDSTTDDIQSSSSSHMKIKQERKDDFNKPSNKHSNNVTKPKSSDYSSDSSTLKHSDRNKIVVKKESTEDSDDDDDNNGMSFDDFLTYDVPVSTKKKQSSSAQKGQSSSKSSSSSKTSSKPSSSSTKLPASSSTKNSNHKSSDSHHHKDKHHSKHESKHSGEKKHKSSHHSSKDSNEKKHRSSHESNDSNKCKERKHKSSHSSKEKNGHRSGDREHKKRKSASPDFDVPEPPPKQMKLSPTDIMATLPEIQPNYKPLPHMVVDSRDKYSESLPEDGAAGSKKNTRTMVYSGRRQHFLTSVPSLYESCMRVLMDNIDALDYVGGVPYDILKPVLEKCSPAQLYNLENSNPQFLEDSDELWEIHTKKDFRNCSPGEMESWREVYLRRHDEREAKLRNLTASIHAKTVAARQPVKKCKLAYVDSVVKPPREVRRAQMRHGTVGPTGKHDPLAKLSSHGGAKAAPRVPIRTDPNVPRFRQEQKSVRRVAPMMQKTLSFMKKLQRR